MKGSIFVILRCIFGIFACYGFGLLVKSVVLTAPAILWAYNRCQRAERREWNDPRLSVEERYSSRAEYLRRSEEAARLLIQEGYLLSEDLQRVVGGGAAHWDWLMEQSPGALRP